MPEANTNGSSCSSVTVTLKKEHRKMRNTMLDIVILVNNRARCRAVVAN